MQFKMDYRRTGAWQGAKRVFFDPVRRLAANLVLGDQVPLAWCEGRNWGDALSPILVKWLSGREVVPAQALYNDRYLVIGSILESANERSEVWGSGFIRDGQTTRGRPKAVHAVRGPLSRQLLLTQGVACPEIYGDPALLLPMFMDPDVKKKYSVGVIPHYVDKPQACLTECRRDPEILVIDIESGIEEFVRAVKSCDLILSSSLHGLICADAYGVPRSRIRMSDAVLGGDFKFRDYGLSVGELDPKAINIDGIGDLRKAARLAVKAPMNLDTSQLLLSCPFLSNDLK